MYEILNINKSLNGHTEHNVNLIERIFLFIFLFEVRLYEILIHSQCITCGRFGLVELEKQTGVLAQKLSNVLLWTGLAAKLVLVT